MFAYDWVATAPTPARAYGTTEPTATNFDSTATPRSFVFGSKATMLNVEDRTGRDIGAGGNRRDVFHTWAATLKPKAPAGADAVHVFLDLYGVLLDSDRMRVGYRDRLVDLLVARFGGNREVWFAAHDTAYDAYVRRVDEVDWDAEPWAHVVDRLDADHYRTILEGAGVSWRPDDPQSFARDLEFRLMSTVDARCPDARPALARLRESGHRVYVATGASDANARGALTGAGLPDALHGVFTGTSQNARKSRTTYWTPIPERIGARPSECVFVDDRLDYLEPAAASGFVALLLDRSRRNPTTPSFVRATLRNLAGLAHYVDVLATELGG